MFAGRDSLSSSADAPLSRSNRYWQLIEDLHKTLSTSQFNCEKEVLCNYEPYNTVHDDLLPPTVKRYDKSPNLRIDEYSNKLLQDHFTEDGVTIAVSADGNCLFNSASVALTGKILL